MMCGWRIYRLCGGRGEAVEEEEEVWWEDRRCLGTMLEIVNFVNV